MKNTYLNIAEIIDEEKRHKRKVYFSGELKGVLPQCCRIDKTIAEDPSQVKQ